MDTDREAREHGDAPLDDSWEQGQGPAGPRRSGDASTYWRRRFLILCGGVAALGACAWFFPGAAHQSQPSASASASMAALASRQALPAAATGPAWTPSPPPSPTPTPTPTASGTKKPKGSLVHKPKASSSPSASASGGSCAKIVLSVSADQSSYTTADNPAFKVYAVSTAAGQCKLAYGAGSVKVVVTTKQGKVMWDSAACKPKPAQPVTFTQGIPRVLTLTWNRTAKGPGGCAGALPAGTTGPLTAVASEGSKSSPASGFKIVAAKPGKKSGTSTQYRPRNG